MAKATSGESKFGSVVVRQDGGSSRPRAEFAGESTDHSPMYIDLKSTSQLKDVCIKFTTTVPVSRTTSLCLTKSTPNFGQRRGIEQARIGRLPSN